MKTLLLSVICIIGAITQAHGQKGYFVTYNNDTVQAQFAPFQRGFSHGFDYDTLGRRHKHEHLRVTPDIAKTVIIFSKENTNKFVLKNFFYYSCHVLTPTKGFVEVIYDSGFLHIGKISMGKFSEYVLQKGDNGDFFLATNSEGLKDHDDDFTRYFSDCPEVAEDVKYYLTTSSVTLMALVKRYNMFRGTKMK